MWDIYVTGELRTAISIRNSNLSRAILICPGFSMDLTAKQKCLGIRPERSDHLFFVRHLDPIFETIQILYVFSYFSYFSYFLEQFELSFKFASNIASRIYISILH